MNTLSKKIKSEILKKKQIENLKQKIINIQEHKQLQNNIINNLPTIKKQILHNFKDIINYNLGDPNKNTVLLIEPRFKEEIKLILANTFNKLGKSWNYVFYCGKSFLETWREKLPNFIEIRPLENDNFENTKLYSDFCKQKELWESLYGNFVLTIQLDTWIMNLDPYNIEYFINLNKSFIGGNMEYTWGYFDKIDLKHDIRNFNGGLSLRKRLDMISVIENFPPLNTLDDRSDFLTEHEDVYFTYGCIKLNLLFGNNNESTHFSLHTIFKDKYFGIHQPNENIIKELKKTNPYLLYLNRFIKR